MGVDWDSLYGSSWSYIDNLTSYNLQEDIIVPDGEKNHSFLPFGGQCLSHMDWVTLWLV